MAQPNDLQLHVVYIVRLEKTQQIRLHRMSQQIPKMVAARSADKRAETGRRQLLRSDCPPGFRPGTSYRRVDVLVRLDEREKKPVTEFVCGCVDVLSFLVPDTGDDVSCTWPRDTTCSAAEIELSARYTLQASHFKPFR